MASPEGAWLPGEAARRRWAEERLLRLWASWGYRELVAPAWLRWEVVAEAEGRVPEQACKFLDYRGDVLALRPDHTVAVARLAAAELRDEPRPLRLAYRGEVYRRRADGAFGGRAEAGVELIGAAGALFDAEAVALAAEGVRELGLSDFRVALGHAGLLGEALDRAGLAAGQRARFLAALQERDFVAAEAVVADAVCGEGGEGARLLRALLPGGAMAPGAGDGGWAGWQDGPAGRELAGAWRLLARAGLGGHLVLEPFLVRDVDYYTGLVFEVTCPGRPRPVAGGGRYDRLLARFGRDEPAVGFAFDLEELVAALAERGLGPPAGGGAGAPAAGARALAAVPVPVADGGEEQAWEEAMALRRAGVAAALVPAAGGAAVPEATGVARSC